MSQKYLAAVALTGLVLVTPAAQAQQAASDRPRTEVSVRDFGGRPNVEQDSTPAVVAALARCRQLEKATLTFPTGTYHFFEKGNPGAPHTVVALARVDDLVIDGRGSLFLCHGDLTAFAMTECNSVIIRNVTIDRDRPSFSQGRVTAVAPGNRGFTIQIDPEYQLSGGEPIRAFNDYDPRTGYFLRGGVDAYDAVASTRLIGPQLLQVALSHPVPVKPSTLLVLRHQVFGRNVFQVVNCVNTWMENVAIYTGAGMGLWASRCRDFHIKSIQIVARPGSGRLMSVTADGLHFVECSGTIEISDSILERMGDDAVNIHGIYNAVSKRLGPRTLEVVGARANLPPKIAAGDRLEFSSALTLIPYAEAVVSEVAPLNGGNALRVDFRQDLPTNLTQGSDLVNNANLIPRSIISNCTVRGNRARGFILKNRDILVEKNVLEYVSGPGIEVKCVATGWYESGAVQNAVVRDNVVRECNNGVQRAIGAIGVYALLPGNRYGAAGVHRDIVIERNTIRDTDNAAIFVSSTDSVTIRENTIQNVHRRPTRPSGDHDISLLNDRRVMTVGNTFSDRGSPATVFVGPGCDQRSITIKGNKGLTTQP